MRRLCYASGSPFPADRACCVCCCCKPCSFRPGWTRIACPSASSSSIMASAITRTASSCTRVRKTEPKIANGAAARPHPRKHACQLKARVPAVSAKQHARRCACVSSAPSRTRQVQARLLQARPALPQPAHAQEGMSELPGWLLPRRPRLPVRAPQLPAAAAARRGAAGSGRNAAASNAAATSVSAHGWGVKGVGSGASPRKQR